MGEIRKVFATQVYQASLAADAGFAGFNADLEAACRMLAQEDKAGQAWSRAHGYGGYTSYASLDDLPRRASVFADLQRRVSRHVGAFTDALAFDLGPRGRLALDALWVSALRPGAGHSGHVHPLGVISGTYYVAVPPGAGALRLEDPRLPLMMAAPPRRADPPFVTLEPAAGALILWESWLRHEVLPGRGGRAERISISFNYAWR
ncbi:MAG TPA: TIGR02466 family protein [Caulobacteraceae bacterium]|nr:TIGR02466 family protein [Caulobacteraceae bacterium]